MFAILSTNVYTVSFSLLINGSSFGNYCPQWGLRQGNPLSPYLFLVVFEFLLKLISKVESLNEIHGIIVARGAPLISHLLHEDSIVLFLREKLP